jgi:hypothetical protein
VDGWERWAESGLRGCCGWTRVTELCAYDRNSEKDTGEGCECVGLKRNWCSPGQLQPGVLIAVEQGHLDQRLRVGGKPLLSRLTGLSSFLAVAAGFQSVISSWHHSETASRSDSGRYMAFIFRASGPHIPVLKRGRGVKGATEVRDQETGVG